MAWAKRRLGNHTIAFCGSSPYKTYEEEWVRALKRSVPEEDRFYNKSTGEWVVCERFSHVVELLCTHFLGDAESYESHIPNHEYAHQDTSFYDDLFITSEAPPEVIDAAYRALVKKYHPDTGGSAEDMKRINIAYETLRSKR